MREALCGGGAHSTCRRSCVALAGSWLAGHPSHQRLKHVVESASWTAGERGR